MGIVLVVIGTVFGILTFIHLIKEIKSFGRFRKTNENREYESVKLHGARSLFYGAIAFISLYFVYSSL